MKTLTLALLYLAHGVWTVAQAQTLAPDKVGVIQTQGALVSTKDGKKALAELQSRLEQPTKELERQQTEIRQLQDQLQRGGKALAEAARNDLVRRIDQKTKIYNRDMQDAQDEAGQEQRRLFDELLPKLIAVVEKYATANGYSLILDASNQNTPVLYAVEAVNITKDIVELYDKESAKPPVAKKQPGQLR